MDMLWASPNIFTGTIIDLYWIRESREQWRSEHKPRQQSPAHPLQARTQSQRLPLGNAIEHTRTPRHCASTGSGAVPEVMQSFGEKATSGHSLRIGDSENCCMLIWAEIGNIPKWLNTLYCNVNLPLASDATLKIYTLNSNLSTLDFSLSCIMPKLIPFFFINVQGISVGTMNRFTQEGILDGHNERQRQ